MERLTEPHALFLCALPGSGKSTYAKQLKKQYPERKYCIISTDNLYEIIGETQGWSYNEAFQKISYQVIHEIFQEVFIDLVADKRNIIIDQTNLTKKSRAHKRKILSDDYTVAAKVFILTQEELDWRLEKRYKETGKYVPHDVMRRMQRQFEYPQSDEFDYIFGV